MTVLISRDDAIEAVLTYFIPRSHTGERGEHEEDFVRTIFNALPSSDAEEVVLHKILQKGMIEIPSADTVQGWRIGKPTEQGQYMVTLDSFGYKHIDLFYYGKPLMPNRKVRGKCWYRSDDEWGDVVYDDTDILAWQPLPKPYCGARMK